MSINAEALKFLQRFNYNKITFQLLKNGKPFDCFTTLNGSIDYDTEQKIVTTANDGAEIFFMVNQGDGIVHEGKKIPRSTKSVNKLLSLFIDTDDAPLSKVAEHIKSLNIKPHLIVETSPSRFHIYFLIEPEEPTQRNIKMWKQLQTALLVEGCDSSMTDVSKVLRVPGYYHRKREPFLTTISHEAFHAPYTMKSLHSDLRLSENHTEVFTESAYKLKNKVLAGDRHAEVTRFLGSQLQQGIHPDQAEQLLYMYIKTSFEKGDDFLPDGKRNHEVKNFIQYKIEQLEEEKRERIVQISEQAIKDETKSKLPDSFYYNAPEPLKSIVKEICEYAPQPIPSLACATAIAAMGTLKSRYQVSGRTAPSNYFLCIAPTGTGKDFPQEFISKIYADLNIKDLKTDGIRSKQGFQKWMQTNKSTGLFLQDEVHKFFEHVNKPNANEHLAGAIPLLLSLYTRTNYASYSAGNVISNNDNLELSYPRLNYVGYGTEVGLESAFSQASISDGFMPRFLLMLERREAVRAVRKEQPLHYNSEEYFRGLWDRAVMNTGGFVNIPYTENAQTLFYQIQDYYIEKRNQDMHVLNGLYSRCAEQVARLAVSIADEVIDESLLKWCFEFVQQCSKNIMTVAEMNWQGEINKNVTRLVEVLASLQRKQSGHPVRRSDLTRALNSAERKQVNESIYEAVESGLIEIVKKKNKNNRDVTYYSMLEIAPTYSRVEL